MNEEICEVPAELWEEYGALQQKARRVKKLDSYAWALEEQLSHFLGSIRGGLPADSEARSKSLHNLLLNRAKKHSRRGRLLEERYRVSAVESSPEDIAVHRLQLRETIAIVRTSTSAAEWRILWSLADGKDYCTVAKRARMSISALKSKICRCRQRLSGIAA